MHEDVRKEVKRKEAFLSARGGVVCRADDGKHEICGYTGYTNKNTVNTTQGSPLSFIIKIKIHSSCESKILSKLIFASCVRYSDRACYGLCVLIKDIAYLSHIPGKTDDTSYQVPGTWYMNMLQYCVNNAGNPRLDLVDRRNDQGAQEARRSTSLALFSLGHSKESSTSPERLLR